MLALVAFVSTVAHRPSLKLHVQTLVHYRGRLVRISAFTRNGYFASGSSVGEYDAWRTDSSGFKRIRHGRFPGMTLSLINDKGSLGFVANRRKRFYWLDLGSNKLRRERDEMVVQGAGWLGTPYRWESGIERKADGSFTVTPQSGSPWVFKAHGFTGDEFEDQSPGGEFVAFWNLRRLWVFRMESPRPLYQVRRVCDWHAGAIWLTDHSLVFGSNDKVGSTSRVRYLTLTDQK
jgi:hypothetical protein